MAEELHFCVCPNKAHLSVTANYLTLLLADAAFLAIIRDVPTLFDSLGDIDLTTVLSSPLMSMTERNRLVNQLSALVHLHRHTYI